MVRTTDDHLVIAGRVVSTTAVVLFRIGDTDVPVAASGAFRYELPLAVGESKVAIGAMNKKKEFGHVTFKVMRGVQEATEPPDPGPAVEGTRITGKQEGQEPPATEPKGKEPVPYEEDRDEGSSPAPLEIHALVIGVAEHLYSASKNLQFPAKDAQAFYDFVTSPDGLGAPPDHVRLLVNENATRGGIIAAMRDMMNSARSTDVFLLYFSGHGQTVNNGQEYCFFTYDSRTDTPDELDGTALTRTDLLSRLEYGKVRKKILFLDACFSGMLARSGSKSMGELREHLFQEMAETDRTLTVFTSSSDMEESFEDATLGGGHGIFTYYLVKGLQGEADRGRYGNNDGLVTVYELDRYLADEVDARARAVKQMPQRPKRACDQCEDFPLSVTSSYDIEKAVPRPIKQVEWTAPPVEPAPAVTPVASPTGRNYQAYKLPPVPKESYAPPQNPRILTDQVYANATTGDKITFDAHSWSDVAVTGSLGSIIINGPGKISGTTIAFHDNAAKERYKESYVVFNADSSQVNITLNTSTGIKEKYVLDRMGVAIREKLLDRRFISADGGTELCVHQHSWDNIAVSGHVGPALVDAKGSIKGDVLSFVDDRKGSYSSGQLVLSDDWTAARGTIAFANGESVGLALGTSYPGPGYALNNSIYENATKDQSINFHDASWDDIHLSGIVGEENIQCKGKVKGDLISVNDAPNDPLYLPSKLVLEDKGRVLDGEIIFKDGTVVKVRMTRSK